uniref:acetyl-CoA carboxylase biotin carboxyl carrier protein subunit n=1 Tax=Ferrovibrio sp. TaxID=1917215 RepID=UPI00260E2D35
HGEAKAKRVVAPLGGDRYRVDGQEIAVLRRDGHRLRLQVDGQERDVVFAFTTDSLHLALGALDFACRDITYLPPAEAEGAAERELRAPMNGKIVAVLAAEGERVSKGQRLVIMEAMKMQHEMVARVDAVVEKLPVKVGDQVATRQLLAALNPAAE